VFEDDVWIIDYPRSGSTWLSAIVTSILFGAEELEKPDFRLESRQLFPEFNLPGHGVEAMKSLARPRLIKTHLPLKLLPRGIFEQRPKVIYIARDVRDVCVARYHQLRSHPWYEYQSDFLHFYNLFKKGLVPRDRWFDHVSLYWTDFRGSCLFITYEDLKQNTREVIARISAYLNVPRTDKELDRIVELTSFDNMKNSPNLNMTQFVNLFKSGSQDDSPSAFYRKGVVGDWRSYFTAEMESEYNQLFLQPCRELGLTFGE